MLINWGLMTGRYQDGLMRTTKFGQFNMAFAFVLLSFEWIKWTILIFCPEESQVTDYLGEFVHFGPKVFVELMADATVINASTLVLLFYFSHKNPNKMLFWLDQMEYNAETQSFN